MAQNFYIVRMNIAKDDDFIEEYIAKNKIIIGLAKIGDSEGNLILPEKDTSEYLKNKLNQAYGDEEWFKEKTSASIAQWVGDIIRFYKIKNNDIIIVPTEKSQSFRVAKVVDDKISSDNYKEHQIFTKKVKFYDKKYTKNNITPNLYKAFSDHHVITDANEYFLEILTLIGENKKIIFFNIGYCEYYQGNEKPTGDFDYLKNNENTGGEFKNFLDNKPGTFGYVPMPGRKLNLSEHFNKNDLKKDQDGNDFLENVLVIWVANKKIIGWYKNATVYSVAQQFGGNNFDKSGEQHIDYFVKADSASVYLTEPNKRVDYINVYKEYCEKNKLQFDPEKTNKPGTSPVFYPYSFNYNEDKKIFTDAILQWISNYKNNEITDPLSIKSIELFKQNNNGGTPSAGYMVSAKIQEYFVKPWHNKVEKYFEQYLQKNNYKIISFNKNFIDCVYKNDNNLFFAEIKPYDDQNSYKYALRSAIGQIIEYYEHQKENYYIEHKLKAKSVIVLAKFYDQKIEIDIAFEEVLKDNYQIEIIHLDCKL